MQRRQPGCEWLEIHPMRSGCCSARAYEADALSEGTEDRAGAGGRRRGLQATGGRCQLCVRKNFPSGPQDPFTMTSSIGREFPGTKDMLKEA